MKIEGYVYFIQGSNEEGLIKIGWAKDPIKRLADLQTACPIPLTLLGAKPGDVTDEKALHRKLAFARFHGEWFAPVPEVLDEIPDDVPEGASSALSYPGSFDSERWKAFTQEIEIRKRDQRRSPSNRMFDSELKRLLDSVDSEKHIKLSPRAVEAARSAIADLVDEVVKAEKRYEAFDSKERFLAMAGHWISHRIRPKNKSIVALQEDLAAMLGDVETETLDHVLEIVDEVVELYRPNSRAFDELKFLLNGGK